MILTPAVGLAPRAFLCLELDQDGQVDPVLDFLQIGRKAGHECARRSANIFDDRGSRTGRRCNSSRSGEVRYIRSAMIKLPAKCDVLAGHVIEGT